MPIAAGSLLIKNMLPPGAREKYDPKVHLNSGRIEDLINLLVSESPAEAHVTLANLGKLFFDTATEQGFSLSLGDYENSSLERSEMLSDLESKIAKVLASTATSKDEKASEINKLVDSARGKLSKQNMDYLLSRGATSAKMALTGARGNPGQLMQASASPILGADARGRPVPIIIRHSYSEGLSPAEAAALSYGARQNTVLAQSSTSKPGAIYKLLTPSLFHEVITEVDCGTHSGIEMDIHDKKGVLYRYEAATDRLIDDRLYHDLLREGRKSIIVRSPLTCEAKTGICQHCYGYMSNRQLPPIGTNVGVLASQSASEHLTQAVLSTKHTGGLAGKSRSGYELADNYLKNPETFQDKAVLANTDGKVLSIEKTELGDHNILVGDLNHFVPREQDIIVKAGQDVRAGDSLSTGTANPRELIKHLGVSKTRERYTHQLRDIYNGSTEASRKTSSIDPRHFDLIARNMIHHVQIDDPGLTSLTPGSKIEINALRKVLKNDAVKESLANAQGKILAENAGPFIAGDRVTERMAEDLRSLGIKEVTVSNSGVKVTPLVPGLMNVKLLDKNWVSKMSLNKLRHSLSEASSLGEESEKHSTDPITSYVLGREFGEGYNPGDY